MVLRLFCAAGTKEAVTNSEAESSVAQTDMRDGGSFVLLPLDWGGGGGVGGRRHRSSTGLGPLPSIAASPLRSPAFRIHPSGLLSKPYSFLRRVETQGTPPRLSRGARTC